MPERHVLPSSILIADDDPVALAVMRAVLDADRRFFVVATAADADGAVEAARRLRPRLAVVDVHMPGGGERAVREIAAHCPGTRIVVVSAEEDAATVRRLLLAGAHRYAVKAAPADEIVEMIAAALGDEYTATVPSQLPPPRAAAVIVAVADPVALLRTADALQREPGIDVVGLAQGPAHAASLAARHRPDVAVVDAGLEPGGGAHAALLVRAASPATAVVAVGGGAGSEELLLELRAGARGYVPPGDHRLADAVRAVAGGGAVLSPPAAAVLVDELLARVAADEESLGGEWQRDRVDRAVSGEGLVTLLQPIVDLRARTVVGHEALSRFTLAPQQRPDVWFAEAAALGRGPALELAAARSAFALVGDLPPGSFLSVNVSPNVAASPELEHVLTPDVAPRIVLEMTEHAPVRDYGGLAVQLDRLRERGVRVAVDDAGAGFASLRHIVLLRPDFIKLDISLCRGIGDDPNRMAMARALVGFAAETGRTVVAEGLEEPADVEALLALDVPLGQGYAFGRPEPPPPAGRFSRV